MKEDSDFNANIGGFARFRNSVGLQNINLQGKVTSAGTVVAEKFMGVSEKKLKETVTQKGRLAIMTRLAFNGKIFLQKFTPLLRRQH